MRGSFTPESNGNLERALLSIRKVNDVLSTLVFLYFVNVDDMLGPESEEEWQGAVRLIHAVLGLPKDLKRHGVFDAFLDTKLLQDIFDSN
jgi:hypothetical protein